MSEARRAKPRHPQRATAPYRARKDRKRWCGGHVGREHQPAIVLSKLGQYRRARARHDGRGSMRFCGWRNDWLARLYGVEWIWDCEHEERCTACGRVMSPPLGLLDRRRCPDYRERTP